MKLLIIALLFSVCAQGQDRFYYPQAQYEYLVKFEKSATFDKAKTMPLSVDGMRYTRIISQERHNEKHEEWIKEWPDGYEVYCGPCEIKINDYEAVEQTVYDNKESFVTSDPPFTIRAIGWTTDTIKCVMLVSELGSPATHQNGYGVRKGWSHLKYLDANKVEVKGFVWLSQEFEW
jgi:hypothetical protein